MILYAAPINIYSNFVYRHLLLKHGADFVFSELIKIDFFEKEIEKDKLKYIEEDLDKTIFQIGVKNTEEVIEGVEKLKTSIHNIKEINVNMGCPQSTLQNTLSCGGILLNLNHMRNICKALKQSCEKLNITSSIKIRIGKSPEEIKVNEYLEIAKETGINKVYIHARTLKYGYNKPAMKNEMLTLKKDFPDIELIYNGDVDSYKSANETLNLGYNGVLIARAMMSNPLIFKQIKNKIEVPLDTYDPIQNDPNIKKIVDQFHIKEEKLNVIKEFIDLSIKYNLRTQLAKTNIIYMLKGISGSKEFIKKINESKKLEDYKKIINEIKFY